MTILVLIPASSHFKIVNINFLIQDLEPDHPTLICVINPKVLNGTTHMNKDCWIEALYKNIFIGSGKIDIF